MASGFIILEHPADIGIEAYGATLREAFENAARGLVSLMAGVAGIQMRQTETITVDAPDPEQLLVRWLSEVLYRYDAARFLPRRISIESFSPTGLRAVLQGDTVDPARRTATIDVKAVTYHQILVSEEPALIRVFFDI